MKTRKALAVLLAVVLMVVPFAVSSYATGTIVSPAIKTVYTDAEFFNPQGLVVNDGTKDVAYTPTDDNFRFVPGLDQFLTVDTTEVSVFYKNEFVGVVSVTVNHILGDLVAIDKGHGRYCLGCGELHEFENCTVTNWIPNDDGGIFVQQTQSGKCEVCGNIVTESIPGSEKFLTLFNPQDGAMTELETTIIGYFYQLVVPLLQMLIGIS